MNRLCVHSTCFTHNVIHSIDTKKRGPIDDSVDVQIFNRITCSMPLRRKGGLQSSIINKSNHATSRYRNQMNDWDAVGEPREIWMNKKQEVDLSEIMRMRRTIVLYACATEIFSHQGRRSGKSDVSRNNQETNVDEYRLLSWRSFWSLTRCWNSVWVWENCEGIDGLAAPSKSSRTKSEIFSIADYA